MNNSFQKNLLIYILLGLVTLGVYWPVFKCEFVKYDDDVYVTDNWRIQSGFNWDSIRDVFSSGYASNWHPLTWLSHMLDWQMFGNRAWGHHLTNLLLHIANTLFLFAVLKRMTKAVWASGFVAAVFALHPLHVESVAWVAERKDVLSAFFWFLTMWCYARYVDRPVAGRYLSAISFFALGLMAKPMLVTLPFVLLLLDWWPLERKNKTKLSLVVEKLPFFALSVVSGVVTFFVQRSGGSISGVEAFGIKSRVCNALVSYIGYISRMVWPKGLAVFYPHPAGGTPAAKVIEYGLLLLLVCLLFIWLWWRKKYLSVGWWWYFGTMIPVIGLVQVGSQAMADRYTYIPLVGLFIIITWGVGEFTSTWRYRQIILSTLTVAVLSVMGVCTRLQIGYWRDSTVLFERALAVAGSSFLMHNNYANVLKNSGKLEESVEHYNKAIKINPNSAEVHNNFGGALRKLGRVDEAVEHFRKAIELKPKLAAAHYNLASVLARQGRTDDAIAQYREGLRFSPRDVDTLIELGYALFSKGRFEEAIESYKKVIGFDQGNIIAHGRLGLALAETGNDSEAAEQFRIVLSARPDDVQMYCNLGFVLERQGKITEAIELYRKALQIDPKYNKADQLLKAALAKQTGR